MFAIADQTAGPNGLKFLREPMGIEYPGGNMAKYSSFYFQLLLKFSESITLQGTLEEDS